jgi:hypothetical protein
MSHTLISPNSTAFSLSVLAASAAATRATHIVSDAQAEALANRLHSSSEGGARMLTCSTKLGGTCPCRQIAQGRHTEQHHRQTGGDMQASTRQQHMQTTNKSAA